MPLVRHMTPHTRMGGMCISEKFEFKKLLGSFSEFKNISKCFTNKQRKLKAQS